MCRMHQLLLVACTVCLSWLLMQAVHEAGHILHAVLSGGAVAKVVLHPLTISRTDLAHNPDPLFVSLGGALWGCLVPLAVASAANLKKLTCAPLLRFFAGFCLIANSVYLGTGAVYPVGDADDLICYGVPKWVLALFGVAAIPAGLCCWNGLGPYFGFGAKKGEVDRRAAFAVAALLGLLVVLELTCSPAA